ncbi:MAG: hypothetical protein M5U01_14860 [Ardenticatenaceae bacterium]|nr:hypothetical protein [Ardenticatenaceae bacterium]
MVTHERVVVTGVGVVSPLATHAQPHFGRLLLGESGMTVSDRPEYRTFASALEARVNDFDRSRMITSRVLRKLLSPSAAYALTAAGGAVCDAGLEGRSDLLKRCSLYVGSIAVDIDAEIFIPAFKASLGQQGDFEISRFATRGIKLLDPLFLVKALPNAGLCGISIQHQVLGPNANITNGAVSGLQAVALAAASIWRGQAKVALAGGYDSLLRMDCVAEHLIAGRLSKRHAEPESACRPFDQERDGYALGEGAAFVMLEAESHARARSARVYGEILGVAHTADPTLIRRPESDDGRALEHAARQALRQAGSGPDDVEVIFGDGLATEVDDLREAGVIKRLVGEAPVPFTAATPALGFTGAASGVFSLVHALMALARQVVPPLINCRRQDPRCPVYFCDRAQEARFRRALVWNSACGQKNVAVFVGSR